MATSITICTRPTAQTLINALSETDNSFLARSIKDLDSSKAGTYNMHSKLWLVAAGVTFVAFTALAAGAFFYAGLFLPTYVPFVGLGSLILAMPVANFVKNFLEYSEASRKEAQKYSTLLEHFEQQNKKTTPQLQNELLSRGILWHQIPGIQQRDPEALTKLIPVLAQAKFLDDKIQEELDSKEKLTTDARDLARANFAENRQKIYDLRSTALFIEDRALNTKVHAAFVNAVLRKSNYNGTLDDVASLTDVGYHERILGDALNDPTGVNTFITFKNRNISPITHADVKRMTVAELGQRFVAALA